MEKSINLTLTVQEVNVVLAALGAQPYGQVFGVVNLIQKAAEEQLKETGNEVAAELVDAA